MLTVRFRDPAGSTRIGEWTNDGIRFGDQTYDREAVDIYAPTDPSKIVCVGLNYRDHVNELDAAPPDRLRLFLKGPNATAGHGDTVSLPDRDRIVSREGRYYFVEPTHDAGQPLGGWVPRYRWMMWFGTVPLSFAAMWRWN